MKPILEIHNVGKRYKLHHLTGGYYSFRERILQSLAIKKNATEEFWALKDVSADIYPGESVGIIGRNGAGKSTLLKILSKITPPTTGKIITRGRVASLLEVGTGFHLELTGRENIFFNGSLLGMKRKEIESKFDEIVDFSGVEKFLDTPLKHFSSGMQLRLAFAVAAFLDPEILIIDEVLAVGDVYFQQKCVHKMTQISGQGRTIIFVSHNFSAVKTLCRRSIVLSEGVKIFDGETEQAISIYSGKTENHRKVHDLSKDPRRSGKGEIRFDELAFANDSVFFGEEIKFQLKLKSQFKRTFNELDFGVNIHDRNNTCLIHVSNRFLNLELSHYDDNVVYEFAIQNFLKPGQFTMTLFLRSEETIQDHVIEQIQFEIKDGNQYGYAGSENIQGAVLPNFSIKQTLH